jgi:hypothetical protein
VGLLLRTWDDVPRWIILVGCERVLVPPATGWFLPFTLRFPLPRFRLFSRSFVTYLVGLQLPTVTLYCLPIGYTARWVWFGSGWLVWFWCGWFVTDAWFTATFTRCPDPPHRCQRYHLAAFYARSPVPSPFNTPGWTYTPRTPLPFWLRTFLPAVTGYGSTPARYLPDH